MEFLGDSITEGVLVNEGRAGVLPGIPFTWPWLSDALHSYAAQTALALGAEWRQVGFGATGLARSGSGGASGALEAFSFFHADCPRDGWQPQLVVINQGTNESSVPTSEYQRLYTQYLRLLRKSYPKATLIALRPFGGAQEAAIKAAASELGAVYIDTTGWYSGPVHPNREGSALLAEKLVQALKAQGRV
jgi:lysophospholipase L1-like esterase